MPPSVIYENLPGPVGDCLRPASLATTAKVPVSRETSLIFTTSHIGLDVETGEMVNKTIEAEFKAIFNCLDEALKYAGITVGIRQAYRLTSYLVDAKDESAMQDVFKRMFPGHTPTWTLVIVKAINVPGMRAEVSADAVLYHESS
jgi:enamine deaminase RidA (YjgF/YER057c/UK114 family)